jgi:hypothetical protein
MEGASQTTASSVALLQPPGGFLGKVTDVQTFCFYDPTVDDKNEDAVRVLTGQVLGEAPPPFRRHCAT